MRKRKRDRDRDRDRNRDRQTDRQPDRQTDIQTDTEGPYLIRPPYMVTVYLYNLANLGRNDWPSI